MTWTDAFARVPPLLAQHVTLAAAAMLLGLVIALPLGVAAARRPGFARIALGAASVVQTIPSLALLALFYPLLLALSAFVPVPALGFLPSLLALALYAILPILRNTVTGLQGIDHDVIEAADGIGMTAAQKLRIVEAPLALPVMMAGVRTAASWTIGAATLSTTVGQSSLGDIIFSGLQTQNWVLVLTGCVAAAGLALVVDALLATAERGVATRRRWLWALPLSLLVIVPVGLAAARFAPAKPVVTIGAKSFSEQYILARLIGRRLETAGYDVRYRENLGSAVVLDALRGGDVDLYVDYSGTLWTNAMKRGDARPRDTMNAAIATWAKPRGFAVVAPLGFENAYALALRGAVARSRGLTTLDDLTGAAPRLTLGGDLEFLDRPEWAAIRDAYGLRFARQKAFAPTFMYEALKTGDADVISAFSSDGRIAADGLFVLADPRRAIPTYDALLLANQRMISNNDIIAALSPLENAISVELMRRANLMVDGEKRSPDEAAAWLDAAIAARRAR